MRYYTFSLTDEQSDDLLHILEHEAVDVRVCMEGWLSSENRDVRALGEGLREKVNSVDSLFSIVLQGRDSTQPVILLRKPTREKDINIVLAFLGGDRAQPFATWIEDYTEKYNPPYRVLGHYYTNLRSALQDYENRE